jgi:hypothetical protein
MKNRLGTILALAGFILVISSVAIFKGFEYDRYLRYTGAILMVIGFMFVPTYRKKEERKFPNDEKSIIE